MARRTLERGDDRYVELRITALLLCLWNDGRRLAGALTAGRRFLFLDGANRLLDGANRRRFPSARFLFFLSWDV